MNVRPFRYADADGAGDQAQVIALWQACGLTRPWNDPATDIARKRTVQPELFLVMDEGGTIVASAMFGYDGHRGRVNYLAVAPDHRRRGHARRLMDEGEARRTALGGPKLSLQLRTDNPQAAAFYTRLGYGQDAAVSFGKRLIADS